MAKKKGIIKKIIWGIIGTITLFILITIVSIILLFQNAHIVSEGQAIENYGEPNSALLVVDIQESITGDYSIFPSLQENSEKLISNINQVIDSFKVHDYPIIYVRSVIANPFVNLINNAYVKGSPQAKYDKRLEVISNLEVIKTGEDSFRKTKLDNILIENKVNELYIVGLDAAGCVNTTVQAAQIRQYKVNIIEEAVISKSERKTDSMMVIFKEMGVKVISMNSLNIMK
jgi:nicotinamidase-related amidase